MFQARNIKQLHLSRCPKAKANPLTNCFDIQLSSDGVSECRSNSISLDVYSIRFIGCKQIYPIKIIRPIDKTYSPPEDHLENVLLDLESCGLRVKQFIADNPKRAQARRCLNHASLFACEYCFAEGTRFRSLSKNVTDFKEKNNLKKKIISEKIEASKKNKNSPSEIKTLKAIEKDLIEEEKNGPKAKSNIVWPSSSRNNEERTDPKVQEILDAIEENPNLSKDERKGVVGFSPLWDIPNFKFTCDVPTEYMHTSCLGVTKRMIELTFSVGVLRQRITKRKLSSTTEFDLCMLITKVVREFSRRARKLDLAVMKAQEMRNIILFFFPHILQCIEQNAKERKLWLLLAFMIRSCVLSSKEFQMFDLEMLETASKEFYQLYEALFGPRNTSYNTHVVGSHMIDMRAHGPLTLTSAFGFEAFYGEMRHSFTPGTQSTLKQIMQKILIKRSISYHCCENTIHYSARDSSLECNSLIYCYEHNEFKLYKIIEVSKNSLICHKQGKYPAKFKETTNLHLDWSKVGVFKKGGLMDTTTCIIPQKKVDGKVLHVGEYLITCPNDVLREK